MANDKDTAAADEAARQAAAAEAAKQDAADNEGAADPHWTHVEKDGVVSAVLTTKAPRKR